jgi:hypothetical protein
MILANIFKRKSEILEDYESDVPGNRKRRKGGTTRNYDVNKLCYAWYKEACAQGMTVMFCYSAYIDKISNSCKTTHDTKQTKSYTINTKGFCSVGKTISPWCLFTKRYIMTSSKRVEPTIRGLEGLLLISLSLI